MLSLCLFHFLLESAIDRSQYAGCLGYATDEYSSPSLNRRFLLAAQVTQGALQRPFFCPPQNHVFTSFEGFTGEIQRMLTS